MLLGPIYDAIMRIHATAKLCQSGSTGFSNRNQLCIGRNIGPLTLFNEIAKPAAAGPAAPHSSLIIIIISRALIKSPTAQLKRRSLPRPNVCAAGSVYQARLSVDGCPFPAKTKLFARFCSYTFRVRTWLGSQPQTHTRSLALRHR